MNDDSADWNVAAQTDDPNSVLCFWRGIITFARTTLAAWVQFYNTCIRKT